MSITSIANTNSGATTLTSGAGATQLGSTITTPGVYVLMLDLDAMANGDLLSVSVPLKVDSGATAHEAEPMDFADGQAIPIMPLGPFVVTDSIGFFVAFTGGAGTLSLRWNVVRLQ